MSQDTITQLRAQLNGQVGHERAMTLIRIAQEEMTLANRIHPQKPAGRAHLNEALAAAEEAYGYFGPGDAMRGPVGVLYAVALAVRNAVGGGSERDRDRAIELIEESAAFPNVPPFQLATGQMVLGQLLIERAVKPLQTPDAMMRAMTGGVPGPTSDDLDRAVACFREVIKLSANSDMTKSATALLGMAELFRNLFGGVGPQSGGLDLARMSSAVSALQDMQSTGFGMNPAAFGLVPGANLLDLARDIADVDPLDRPVPIVTAPEPEENTSAAPSAPPPKLTVDPGQLRRELAELLSMPEADVYAAAISLLRSDEDPPPWTDEFLALATRLVHALGQAGCADQLLVSAALLLRSRRDGDSGWEAEDQEADDALGSDLQAAADALVDGAAGAAAGPPEALPLLLLLAGLLPAGTLGRLAEPFAGISTAVRATGAGALIVPQPAGLPWLDAQTGQLMPADEVCHARHVVVLGDGSDDVGDDKAVTCLASAAQLVELAGREPRALTEEVVFVANPRGDHEGASVDALVLRRAFHPRSTGLGRVIEDVHGEGTAEQVRAAAGASLLHLGCGMTADGVLQLTDSVDLDVSELDGARGLVILPPGVFLPAADALLVAGFSGVVGWRRAVPEHIASLMLYVLHAELVETGRSPAAAVREVRRWGRRPDPSALPQLLARYAEGIEKNCEEDWSVLVYRGR